MGLIECCIESLVYPERPWTMPRDQALAALRRVSGRDYGENFVEWVRWAKAEGGLPDSYPEDFEQRGDLT